jgi:hypothetical protein
MMLEIAYQYNARIYGLRQKGHIIKPTTDRFDRRCFTLESEAVN